MLHKYRTFGLNLLSAAPLTSMKNAEFDRPDVSIEYGSVPESLNGTGVDGTTNFKNWEASKNHFLLDIPDVAKYYVTNGDRICIETYPDADQQAVLAFLISSAVAALLQQRRLLTLHASAVKTEHGAALFLGKSGAGKSTLSSVMQQRGHAMLSDDISAVDVGSMAHATVVPSFPTTRLWGDALTKIGRTKNTVQRLRTELDKFLVPADDFCETPQKINLIFHLSTHNGTDFKVHPLNAAERFRALSQLTFRQKFYHGQELAEFHFEAVMQLVKNVEMVGIVRPGGLFLLDELVDIVSQNILSRGDS